MPAWWLQGRGSMTRFQEIAVILVLALVFIASLYDIAVDLSYGTSAAHLLSEAMLLVLSLALIVWLASHIRAQNRRLEQIKREIAEARHRRAAAASEAQEARDRLSEIMRRQFQQWQLTRGEQEVALLLLKGLSFKEIAGVRETQEKTVRQQASAIYRKAGVGGRHAFAAWFIEDFL